MHLFTAMRVFNSVATHKNFAAAARELGMSTSSVSRHVMGLEDELGVRLFNRTTRRLSLTEQGRQYHERSAEILDDLNDLHNVTRDSQATPTGRLRLTASQTLGEAWVVPLLPKFYEQYPEIIIELDITDRMADLVEEGFDAGIRSGELKESTMIARKLMDQRYIACASPGYCDDHGLPTALEQLQDH
ncbi:MAG: LysR family transcriptional regulator, partial [Alphaproteobacteria bacterium]|nr:LysR family transcriptional regulator [Alphaproteobacteria bacterium]